MLSVAQYTFNSSGSKESISNIIQKVNYLIAKHQLLLQAGVYLKKKTTKQNKPNQTKSNLEQKKTITQISSSRCRPFSRNILN